jgi:uncharacterized protein YutE (UPF0331/DUF86 family)
MSHDDTNERVNARIAQLLGLADGLKQNPHSLTWVLANQAVQGQAFLVGAANVIGFVTGSHGVHWERSQTLLADPRLANGVPWKSIGAMQGVLSALKDDVAHGLLGDIRLQDFAVAFDDFLDQAAEYHKAGKIIESAVLASAVLEDVMRRIAERYGVAASSLEDTINALTKKEVFTPVLAKRIKAWAGVRTSAFHAKWEELDLPAIGEAIRGIRGLIDEHLT